MVEQKRKNNRCLQVNRKGFKPSIRRNRYSCQPKDLIKINGNSQKIFEVIGTHCYGKNVVVKSVNNSRDKIDISVKKITWKYHFGGLVFKGAAIPPLPEVRGLLAEDG